jgi:L-iditol 2-dehydrogenase
MKALVKYQKGDGNMEIRDVPEPVAGKDQVKIEVKATGICGSDLHIYHDDIAIPLRPPVITGHEFAGVIAAVGEGVNDWQVGDRVVSETAYAFCGRCEYCINGFYNLCNERRTLGYWYNGAFTNYTVVPAARVHRLPENLDFISGALIEPLACVVHAVLELTQITAGDTVLVTGPGAVGLMAMQVANAQGATTIVAGATPDRERLKMAEKLGAAKTINVIQQDLRAEVAVLTASQGVDVVLECSGNAAAANDALLAIKKRGQFTQIGLFGKPITLDFERIGFKELKVTGSLGSRWVSWQKALQLATQAKVQLRPLVSDIFPLAEWQKAFTMFEKKQGLKLILTPIEG